MEIMRNGTQPSGRGPAEHFTGIVRIDPLFQSSPSRLPCAALALLALFAVTTSCTKRRDKPTQAGIVGAWKLAALEEGGGDGSWHRADAAGSLIFTVEGRMSVQVMYRDARTAASGAPVQYAQGGYEASFGRYEADEQARSFTYHVEGALVRTLVGKDMKRLYELSGSQLVVKPPTADEHWRVTWERY